MDSISEAKISKPLSKFGKVLIFITLILLYIAAPFLIVWSFFDIFIFGVLFIIPLSALLPFVLEIVIRKKHKLSPLLFSPASLTAFLFYAVAMFFINDDFAAYALFAAGAIMFALRIFILIIELIIMEKYKLIAFGVAGFVFAGIFFALIGGVIYPWYEDKITEGKPDRLGSWSYINDAFSLPESWKQIAENSQFKLGPVQKDSENEYFRDIGSYPLLNGSTVCVPMAMEFAKQHLGLNNGQSEYFADFATTSVAYDWLINPSSINDYSYYDYYEGSNLIEVRHDNKLDLILATEPSKDELKTAKEAGVTLVKKPVCYDAFVFITHKNNTVDNITSEQIRKIYSGKIKNWKDVGGEDQKIVAYQREENSGSQTAMENLVMGGKHMINPKKVKIIMEMGGLVDAVAEYENNTASIGYTYKYYIDNLYQNDEIKILSVDGVYPSDENIRNGSYPYTTNYYGVIRGGDENKTGGLFLDWILSDEGQKCVKQAGYIPMKDVK